MSEEFEQAHENLEHAAHGHSGKGHTRPAIIIAIMAAALALMRCTGPGSGSDRRPSASLAGGGDARNHLGYGARQNRSLRQRRLQNDAGLGKLCRHRFETAAATAIANGAGKECVSGRHGE
jgi:hypothetical protein